MKSSAANANARAARVASREDDGCERRDHGITLPTNAPSGRARPDNASDTSSNLVGACTGRSAASVPRRMRLTRIDWASSGSSMGPNSGNSFALWPPLLRVNSKTRGVKQVKPRHRGWRPSQRRLSVPGTIPVLPCVHKRHKASIAWMLQARPASTPAHASEASRAPRDLRFSLRLGDSPWRGARTTRLVMTSGQPRVRSSNEKNNVAARTQSSFDRTIVTPQAPRGRRCSAGRWEGIIKTRFIGFRGGSP